MQNTGNANRRENVIHKKMPESMNPKELTLRGEEIKKEGEKNTLLLMARHLKSHQLCGH